MTRNSRNARKVRMLHFVIGCQSVRARSFGLELIAKYSPMISEATRALAVFRVFGPVSKSTIPACYGG